MPLKFKQTRYLNYAIPLLILLLLVQFLLFVINSVKIVSDTNKNNFVYTIKVRDSIEEIDKIVERAEVNLSLINDIIAQTYDINNLNNKKYNYDYIYKVDSLIKSALINTPGVTGTWFQINVNVPDAEHLYIWYELKNGKFVSTKQLNSTKMEERSLTPEDDPYYFEAIKQKNTVWSDIYTDADTGEKMITISQPVYKNGKLIGVSGVDISLENLMMALTKMQKHFVGSEMFLLDNKGNILLSKLLKDHKIISNSYIFNELIFKQKEKQDTMIEYFDKGNNKTAILLGLSNKYNIVMTFEDKKIYSGLDRLFKTIYFIFLILFSLIALFFLNKTKIAKINERLEDETNKLRAIIDSSPNAILIKDLRGVYTDCNNKFLEYVGIKKEDLIGKTDYDIFTNTDEINEILKNEKSVKDTQKIVSNELCYENKDGSKVYIEKQIIPLLNEKNELTGLLINASNITKQKQEQEILQKAKDEAEKATIIKSNFLANMSHEIRTPLNGMLGFIQLLKDTSLTEEQEEFINDAQKSSELLLDIINDILDFSKIEADKLKIDNVSFDIRSLVEDATIMATSNAQSKGLEINSLICSDVPQKVFGDPGRVKQILNNLISNAIKFTHDGEVVIYVKNIHQENNNATISFEVKDTGIGIAKENQNLIFEEFTQADASMTRKYGGTGLGLAICKKLIEMMGGRIYLESNVNEGSTFTFAIPFKIDTNIDQEINFSLNVLNGTRLLVVNDNQTDLRIFRYYLNEINCIILEAHSQQEALDILKQNDNLATALIDYKIENAGEIELSQQIKQDSRIKDIPLILYTSLAKRGDSTLAKEKGFKGYITKPIKKYELIETLATAMSIKEEKEEPTLVTKHLINEIKFSQKAKVLVVEDSEINCKLILKILKNYGLACDLATNGQEAVEAYKTHKYDLILMDCQMPVLNGYEATEIIRKTEERTGNHTPIIALTANALSKDEERCYSAGMDDYISKPIIIDNIIEKISKYIELEKEDSMEVKEKYEEIEEIESIVNEMSKELAFTKAEAIQFFVEYLEILPKSVDDLEDALNDNDFEKLKQTAHKLKGSSSSLRIEKITQLSSSLELEAINKNKETCSKLVNDIKTNYEYFNALLLKFTNNEAS